jgi:putative two-component system response regulator
MQINTPQYPRAPIITALRPRLREAIGIVESRWRTHPSDLLPGDARDRALEPLFACAAAVAEPGAISHMHQVGRIAELVALGAGWSPDAASDLRVHAALHDIGKLGVSAAILTKPGPLTVEERRAVDRHPALGQRLLAGARSPLLRVAARVAGEHHEWWDGNGYPKGVAGHSIHPSARVIAIADVFDALTSRRPYRGALSEPAALEIMVPGRGTQFDPDLFDVFLAVCFPTVATCESAAV